MYREESGSAMGILMLLLGLLLVAGVFLVDGGRSHALKTHAYSIAESVALSAATELDNGESKVIATAHEVAALEGIEADQMEVEVTIIPNIEDTIVVTVTLPQKMFFGELFGVDSRNVVGVFTYTRTHVGLP